MRRSSLIMTFEKESYKKMADTYKVLDSKWYTNPTIASMTYLEDACIGIVAIKTNTHEPDDVLEWKCYIGLTYGINREADEQRVAALGSGLPPEEAAGFFPHLDIAKYKAY